MNRLRTLVVCTLLGVALAAQGRLCAQQIVRDVVYDDSLVTSKHWFTGLWTCNGGPTLDTMSTAAHYNGQRSISVYHSCIGGWGAFVLNRRMPGWVSVWMDTAEYKNLVFWFNPGSSTAGDSSLAIFTGDNGALLYLRDYLPSALVPNRWRKIVISTADLRPDGSPFCALYFWNMSGEQTQYYLDGIAFDRYVADPYPPQIPSLTVANRGYSTVTIAMTTNEPTRYEVSYTNNGTTRQKSIETFALTHSIVLDSLVPATSVGYSIAAIDTAGNRTNRNNRTTSTRALPVPSLISPSNNATVRTFSALLKWRTTAEASSYTVQIAQTSDFASILREVTGIVDTTLSVGGLQNGVHYWRVHTSTPHGNSNFSAVRSFTMNITQQVLTDIIYDDAVNSDWRVGVWDCANGTVATDPAVSSPRYAGQYSFGATHTCNNGWGAVGFDRRNDDWTRITYMSPGQYRVLTFAINPGSDTAAAKQLFLYLDNGSAGQFLSAFLPVMQPNQWHTVRVPIAEINQNNEPFFRIYFFNEGSLSPKYHLDNIALEYVIDTTPPVVSNLAVDSIMADGAVMRWTTDELANYTLAVAGGGQTISLQSDAYAQSFRASLFDRLQPSTTYSYRLAVADYPANGRPANTTIRNGTFTTLGPDTTAPVPLSQSVQATGPAHVALSVATNEQTRLTVQYGVGSYNQTSTDSQLLASRVFEIHDLAPNTTYQYRLVLTDKFGNSSTIASVPPFTWATASITGVAVTVSTEEENRPISPYIYGTNNNDDELRLNMASRRLGGNRLTGYNWETNYSHAGTDWFNNNDDYLPWKAGIPDGLHPTPGIVQTTFHDSSLARSAPYTLLTLQAAGYAAADENGTVPFAQTAPSSRWKQVRFKKNAPLSLAPDTTDNYVYMDEQVNFMVNQFGGANTATGIKGYSVDNEPDLWFDTHVRMHPQHVGVRELTGKTIDLATAVKDVDPNAEIFGPASYGFYGFLTLQDAPDWPQYSSYGTFINAYLDTMRRAETATGRRLLDVLDLHWYPEARGINYNGGSTRITDTSAAPGMAYARMQAPRTLWDQTYTETSWVRDYFGNQPWALLPWLKQSIDTYYPSTKLAITEYAYGAPQHVSGGIAVADVLGVFGKYGVYMANHWDPVQQYIASAFRIYRNFDGANSAFGDISVRALASDVENISIYAAKESNNSADLHLIIINKHQTEPRMANVSIASPYSFIYGNVWAFDRLSPAVTERNPVMSIVNNTFSYQVSPMSVYHIILHNNGTPSGSPITTGLSPAQDNDGIAISVAPNPVQGLSVVTVNLSGVAPARLALVDALGREVATLAANLPSGLHSIALDARTLKLAPGVYFCVVQAGSTRCVHPVVITQ